MKKILAIMITLVFVLAFSSCLDLKGDETTAPTVENTDESTVEQDNPTTTAQDEATVAPETDENGSTVEATTGEADDTTAAAERTTASTEQTGGSKAYAALSSGNFYMACNITDESGNGNPVVFANRGENLRMSIDKDGSNVGIIIADGKMYMVFENSYAELSEQFLTYFGVSSVDELIKEMGVTDSFASDMFEGLTFDKAESATYGGQAVTKYSYTKAGGSGAKTVLYEKADGTLVCMENIDNTGKVTQTTVFTDFKTTVPDDAFSVSGYTQADFFELMMSMWEVIGDESLTPAN